MNNDKTPTPENKLMRRIGTQYSNAGVKGSDFTSCSFNAAMRNKILNSIHTSVKFFAPVRG